MRIPISYNLRNLRVRRTTTLMTALGIALTVAVLLSVMALVDGLRAAFASTGSPLRLIVMRKGATAELSSGVTRTQFQDLKFKPGIARTAAGEPAASLELVTVVNLPSIENPDGTNLTVRGLLPVGVELRGSARIVEGRMFRTGHREVIVGRSIARRYPTGRPGGRILLGRGQWDVVGVFTAGGGAAESEVWADLNQVGEDYNRAETASSVLIRATDEVAAAALINDLGTDRRLNFEAITEKEYYDQQTSSAAPVRFLGIFVAVIMAIGSSFAAMNTMYAAVARRSKEIGTLRVLGFSKGSILLSFLVESLLLALLGGLIGCALVLPLNGFTTGVGSNTTFAEVAFNFRVGPQVMLSGVLFALCMGAFGGLFPAYNAARKEILTALKEL